MLEGYLVALCVRWLPVFGGLLYRTLTTANDYFILKAVEGRIRDSWASRRYGQNSFLGRYIWKYPSRKKKLEAVKPVWKLLQYSRY